MEIFGKSLCTFSSGARVEDLEKVFCTIHLHACIASICMLLLFTVSFLLLLLLLNSFYYITIIAIKSTHFWFGNWFPDQANTTLLDSQGIQYAALQVAASIWVNCSQSACEIQHTICILGVSHVIIDCIYKIILVNTQLMCGGHLYSVQQIMMKESCGQDVFTDVAKANRNFLIN